MTAPPPRPWPKPAPAAAAAPAGLRRRQSAARRLPPLADGRRDPIAPTPRSGTLLDIECTSLEGRIQGITTRQFFELCRRAGLTRYSTNGRHWCVPLDYVAELLSVAQYQLGWAVSTRNAER